MKFDRRLLLPFENDGDIRSMMRGNDGHAYVYVTAMEVPLVPQGREVKQNKLQMLGKKKV